jgi:hypothetical protein
MVHGHALVIQLDCILASVDNRTAILMLGYKAADGT